MRRAPVTRVVGGLLGVVLAGALGACGDDGGQDTDADSTALPSCLASLTPVTIPTDGTFPTDWAFPPGTVVTGTQEVPGGGLAITAQVGADFEKVLPFMQSELEKAGFVATKGEAEHDDAEATWTGGGFSGTWAIKASEDCAGTTLLQVAAAPQ